MSWSRRDGSSPVGIARFDRSGDPPNPSDTLALALELNERDSYGIVPESSRYPTTPSVYSPPGPIGDKNYILVHKQSTMADNPSGQLEDADGPITVADRVYSQSIFSNVIAFETENGLVLIDATDKERGPEVADRLREATDQQVHTVIYTHGHVDHVHGLENFLIDDQQSPEIIAHENIERRFNRYELTKGHNNAINARQFGGTVDADPGIVGNEENSPFQVPDHPPTQTYTDDLTLSVGGLTFELHHGRGETDDHTWVYCPEKDVICTGDFLISAAPNPGNPQKVQRYPGEWIDELKQMRELNATTACPGHGKPMVDDPEAIDKRFEVTIDYLSKIVDQTIEALNNGSPPHVDIIHEVDLPEPDSQWLKERYDEGEFIIRNIIRYYGGWWTGRPSELKPAPREAVAKEIAALCDGPENLAERAKTLTEDGDLRLACHLADYALEAAPDNERVQESTAEVYNVRAANERSLMATNLYNSAQSYAEDGRPFR